MAGSFTSGRFRFELDRSDWESDSAHGLHEELEDWDFGLRLAGTGRIPDLGGAPLASWLLARLARLARLTDDALGLAGEEHNDGGGYVVEFAVYRASTRPDNPKSPVVQPLLFDMAALGVHFEPVYPVASFQLQAEMEGIGVLGSRAEDCPVSEVLEAFAAALLADPSDLACCEVAVYDPEWELDGEMYTPTPFAESRNWYGWDGQRFLGQDNIREAAL
jgi:hypothetical protein